MTLDVAAMFDIIVTVTGGTVLAHVLVRTRYVPAVGKFAADVVIPALHT